MKFNMTAPCAHCPFRMDIPAFISKARRTEIATSVVDRKETFPCHKTVDYSGADGQGLVHSESQHCAGALIMLEHMGRPNQMMRIAERLEIYDHTKLRMDAPVFRNKSAFVKGASA